LLAASIGIRDEKREPLGLSESGKAIPENYFSSPGWHGFLYLIRLVETGNSDCLHSTPENQDQLITAFEEYANYGLKVLKERLASSTNLLDDLTSFVLEATQEPAKDADIDNLI
jgi:dnd system-associated protein 4